MIQYFFKFLLGWPTSSALFLKFFVKPDIVLGLFFIFFYSSLPALSQPSADSNTVNQDKLFYFIFDNDATFKVDYYYTQGIGVVHYNPVFQKSLVNKILLISKNKTDEQFYGLAYKYDGFTPTNIRDPEIRLGDRPYASYMFVSQFAGTTNQINQQRITSSLDLGIIGPATGAGKFQRKIHEFLHHGVPQGWKYQIKTDVIINYSVLYQKGLIQTKPVEVLGEGGASLGTLYTQATVGAFVRFGWMNHYFSDLGISNKTTRRRASLRKWQLYGFGRTQGKLVGYNATMQGGFLNNKNVYTLKAPDISRTVLESQTGVVLVIKGLRLETAVSFISPEFKGSRRHKWMHFNVGFAF